jgi:hypothetical protein
MRRAAAGAFALGALAAVSIAWYYITDVPSGEYPGLLDAYDLASPERQPAMRSVVTEAANRSVMFNFSRAQRDRFLEAGGYCRAAWQSRCRPVPRGLAAEGDAIERFAYVARWGKSWPQ